MLVKKIRETKDLVEEVSELEERKDEYESYKDFRDTLKKEKEYAIDKFIATYELLSEYNPQKFNDSFNQSINIIQALLSELNKGKVPREHDMKNLVDRVQENKETLKKEWQEHAGNKSQGIVDVLENIKELFDNSAKIKEIIKKIDMLINKWPITKGDLNEFENCLSEGKGIIQKLDVDSDIQEFLEEVSRGRATVTDLSWEIIEWLEENNFKDKLTITFFSDSGLYG